MKLPRALVSLAVTLSLLNAVNAFAAGPAWRGSGGWGPGAAFGRLYDPKTVETVNGEVTRIDKIVPMRGMSPGVHLALKTDGGPVDVHLGPEWFLVNQDVRIAPGDRLEVKGSKVTIGGKPAIIASEIVKGDETLKLRNETGIPVWSGWRRG